ncbi:hypothetical protein M409DRAFT_55578 [Zasmidium cellare ATCC 36951]|uniref:Sialidase n=1 Tax=Zasmidium cellare ATCC 36951 TaxID=1080233 RepID=A0A6A6CIA5_ZASCE|nr:uncharacterized protein M409DRAFT_55578 [Zasmidium cellare ATCC 36951]KAF2165692.1 hypothetical protein M409DRAFT_55578 [Zasmidium cellare ATCC 36951]
MDFRHVTPPSEVDAGEYDDLQCPGGSASTDATYYPHDWSPQTVMTCATTPPRSPMIIRENGSRLLPKPRDQDQLMEPASGLPSFPSHSRTASLPSNVFSMQFGPALPGRPSLDRRSTSPRGRAVDAAPTPAPSPYGHLQPESMLGNRPSMGNMRSVSSSHISSVRSHSRNASSSSIDASMLSRYGYPTYRQSPTPQPVTYGASMSRTPSAMSHLAPIAMPGGQVQNYPNSRRTASPPANPSRLSVEVEPPEEEDLRTSTVLEYLTGSNPTPSLIQRINETNKAQNSHFWFDIRNLRAWSDFDISTISSIPGLLDLLKIDISLSSLPTPSKVNLAPETPAQLAELCASHHAVKVNAALRVAQGDKHISMRTLRLAPGARQQPEFIANYQSDAEKTIYGDGRGRVVGIVKSYDQWNSGYRHGSPVDKIRYLEHLAHLQRFMREHGTRYGFIMTEIELVCVRMGGTPNEENIPLFGYLELSPPIQISSSCSSNEETKMTAGLALFYLHMLAKEQPFPRQFHWRVDVGGPTALTRKRHLERDEWMPKVNQQDKRGSKRIRGWVWPDEPLHKRECGKAKRKS